MIIHDDHLVKNQDPSDSIMTIDDHDGSVGFVQFRGAKSHHTPQALINSRQTLHSRDASASSDSSHIARMDKDWTVD